MRSLTVRIEGELPDMQLATNRRDRLHYQARARFVRAANLLWYGLIVEHLSGRRDLAAFQWPYAGSDPLGVARLTWEIWWPKGPWPDKDNLSSALKVVLDTLCVATKRAPNAWRLGLIVDDSPRHLIETTLLYHPGEGPAATQFTLEEVE
jgi:hypothetical protein